MPTMLPSRSTRAPPELPGEMAASVWIRSESALAALSSPPVSSGGKSRPTALTTPEGTVASKPAGRATSRAGRRARAAPAGAARSRGGKAPSHGAAPPRSHGRLEAGRAADGDGELADDGR